MTPYFGASLVEMWLGVCERNLGNHQNVEQLLDESLSMRQKGLTFESVSVAGIFRHKGVRRMVNSRGDIGC